MLVTSDHCTLHRPVLTVSRFDSLDRDGSGEIGAEDLFDPLLSTGLARSALEVHNLVRGT